MRRKIVWLLLALALTVGALVAIIVVPAGASGVKVNAAATVAPAAVATRADFAVIAVSGLGLSPTYPSVPTYSDVSPASSYYSYVEGATAKGLVRGLGGGVYGPDLQISRQQVATILARYLSAIELSTFGYITGSTGLHYDSLDAWYGAEGEALLAAFSDQASISTVHRPGVAYLAMYGIALGTDGRFIPLASVTQTQSAALVQRVAQVAASFSQEIAVPGITSITPTGGPSAGGTTVYIYGTNFTSDATVHFGGVAATSVTVVSSTLIVAVSPAGTAGSTVQVSVTTDVGTSADTSADDFTYYSSSPVISSVSPSSGWVGDTVTIYGSNFSQDGLEVYFGGVEATHVTYVSSTQLRVIVPAGHNGDTVRVTVLTDYGSSAAGAATYFTYKAGKAPSVSYISPDTGWEGDTVTIIGTNFDQDGLEVYFDSVPVEYITYVSSTELMVIVPAGYDGYTVLVTVVTDYGSSAASSAAYFTYCADLTPYIDAIHPDSGWEGDTVTIYGANFDEDGLAVYFGGEPVEGITYVSDTKLKVIVPAGNDGRTVRVKVETDYGTSPNTPADDFTYDDGHEAPIVTHLSPNYGEEGDTVTIFGRYFDEASVDVYFDGEEATDVTWVSSTELTVTVPAGTDGDWVLVTVVTAYGASGNTWEAYFFYGPGAGYGFPWPHR